MYGGHVGLQIPEEGLMDLEKLILSVVEVDDVDPKSCKSTHCRLSHKIKEY